LRNRIEKIDKIIQTFKELDFTVRNHTGGANQHISTQGSDKFATAGNGINGDDLESKPLMRQRDADGEYADTKGLTNR
jgi:hypothetical protein